jgi:hypothetical protein
LEDLGNLKEFDPTNQYPQGPEFDFKNAPLNTVYIKKKTPFRALSQEVVGIGYEPWALPGHGTERKPSRNHMGFGTFQ